MIGWEGDPPHTYVVTPRTTRGGSGIPTPAGVLPGLTEPGRFVWRAYPASADDVENAEYIGDLEDPYLKAVLEEVNTVEFDLD